MEEEEEGGIVWDQLLGKLDGAEGRESRWRTL
jgi:hypothetical protein